MNEPDYRFSGALAVLLYETSDGTAAGEPTYDRVVPRHVSIASAVRSQTTGQAGFADHARKSKCHVHRGFSRRPGAEPRQWRAKPESSHDRDPVFFPVLHLGSTAVLRTHPARAGHSQQTPRAPSRWLPLAR